MKTVVIANPAAGAGKVGRAFRRINDQLVRAFGPVEARLTQGPGGATLLARRAIEEGAERIVAVGGDGTMNEVVNGFAAADGTWLNAKAELAFAPVGTGGDFARSVGLSGVDLDAAYKTSSVRSIDLGKGVVTGPTGAPVTRYFINIASFGSSGMVVHRVNKSTKRFGSKASFIVGTLRGLAAYRNQRVRLRVDDTFDEELVVSSVSVANGRYFGGSMKIAPLAKLGDGLFDLTVIGDLGLVAFLSSGRHLYTGEHLKLPQVRRLQGRVVQAEPLGKDTVFTEFDGEQPGNLAARFELMAGAIRFFAPWSSAEGA